jgi:hypothetical protein
VRTNTIDNDSHENKSKSSPKIAHALILSHY